MLKTYEVTNLFNGKVDTVLAHHMEDAMIRFLCDHFFPPFVAPMAREQIRMYGLSSVAHIGGLKLNHLIYKSWGHVCEWEFILKG